VFNTERKPVDGIVADGKLLVSILRRPQSYLLKHQAHLPRCKKKQNGGQARQSSKGGKKGGTPKSAKPPKKTVKFDIDGEVVAGQSPEQEPSRDPDSKGLPSSIFEPDQMTPEQKANLAP